MGEVYEMKIFTTSDLTCKIKKYQDNNPILKKMSHHFVFDCPFDHGSTNKPDYIWMGLNPGNDEGDWQKTNYKNDEETRDRNFQEIFGRSRGSKTRMTKVRKFLGEKIYNKTTHTELFFWSSKNINGDFNLRYGTNFFGSPHLEFCCELNKLLMARIKPKAIFFESIDSVKILERFFNLEKKKTHTTKSRLVDEYILNDKYRLINFDHLSAGPPASLERKEVSELVREIIGTNG